VLCKNCIYIRKEWFCWKI